MTELGSDSPRRYFVDHAGRRVLVGLTVEETSEFETLDSLAAANHPSGHVLWQGSGFAARGQDQRWLELYTKHKEAWSRWMADRRVAGASLPFLN
jgi:hypothetical protein